VLLVNKIDYLEMSDFDLAAMQERALRLNPRLKIFELSAKTGDGLDAWVQWLKQEAEMFLATSKREEVLG
jgi:hydrogenase nickel incorporation protein HypB